MPKLSPGRLLTGSGRNLAPAQIMPTGGTGPASPAFRSGWWFEPLQPTSPLAPAGQRPRRFEYTPGHNLLWTPRDGAGVSFDVLRQLSYALDILRVCIEFVKAQIRGLDWEVRPTRQGGESNKAYRTRAKDDPIAQKLRQFFMYPDGQESFHTWLNRGLEDILVADAWSLLLERDTRGRIAKIQCVDGQTIVPLVTVEGWTPVPPTPAYYQTLYGAPAFLLTTDDLIYSPFNRINRGANDLSLYGYSPVEQVILTINQLLRNEQFCLTFFTEGNIPEAIAGVPSDWCYADDTEVLTQRGWLRFTEVDIASDRFATRSRDGRFEWQRADGINLTHYTGPMVHLRSSAIDCLVNPPHRVLVSVPGRPGHRHSHRHRTEKIMLASDLLKRHSERERIPVTSTWEGRAVGEQAFRQTTRRGGGRDLTMSGDDFCAFMGAYLAEGYVSGRTACICAAQGKRTHRPYGDLLHGILGRAPAFNRDSFAISHSPLARYLAQFGTAPEKFIPAAIMEATPAQIRLFLRFYTIGDGSQGHRILYTSSRRMAGQLQELFQKTGRSATVRVDDRRGRRAKVGNHHAVCRHVSYLVCYGDESCQVRKFTVSAQDYDGLIGCVSVPNGILYVRRNGKACWSGNTPKQIEELQAWFDATEQGNLATRRRLRFIPTVAGGVGEKMNIIFPKINTFSFDTAYPQMLAQIIGGAFRVSPQWIMRKMNRAEASEHNDQSEELGTASWKIHIEETLTAIITEKMGFTGYEFAFKPRTESDALKRMQVDTGYVKTGVKSVNEIRDEMGYEAFDIAEANEPFIITGTGPVPLDNTGPMATAQADQAPNPIIDVTPTHAAPLRGALRGKNPKALPPAPGETPDPDDQPPPGARRTRPEPPATKAHRLQIGGDTASPLRTAAEQRLRAIVHRANADIRKQLLDSPQLRELEAFRKADDPKPPLPSTPVVEILDGLGNGYAIYLPEIQSALADAARAGIVHGTAAAPVKPATRAELETTFQAYAHDRAAALVTQIDETTRKDLRRVLTDAFADETDMGDLEDAIAQTGAFSDWRAAMIARTEVGNAMIKANLATWKASGAAEYIQWEVGDEPCEICEPNDGEVRRIGEPFSSGDTEPLVHPNCFCLVIGVDAPPAEKLQKAKAGTVYLMRHGATLLNAQQRLRGQSAVPLDPAGRKAVIETAARLEGKGLTRIVSSETRRARESAHIVGKTLGIPVSYDADLNAWDTGDLTGQPTETSGIAHYIEHPDDPVPGGESLNDFRKRALKAVARHQKDAAKAGPTLLVTHNSVMMAVREAQSGKPPKPNQPDPAPPAGVVQLKGKRLVTV